MGWARAKKEKKIFSFGTVFTRPELENSKINSKKIQKNYLGFISSWNRLGHDEKKRKKISRSEPLLPDLSLRIPKKIAQKFKKLKNSIMASFEAETSRDRQKKREKFSSFGTDLPDPSLRIPKEISKKFKQLKNIIQASFQAEMGWAGQKRENKIFSFETIFTWSELENYQKNNKKVKKTTSGLHFKLGQAEKERKKVSRLELFLLDPS